MSKKIFLEETTNTHAIEATEIKVLFEDESIKVMNITGQGLVTHGEHGKILTESSHVIKYVQQELNPITKKIENAFD